MTARQQIRWGVVALYAILTAEVIIQVQSDTSFRVVAWVAWGVTTLLVAIAVAIWNRRSPGD